MNVRMSVFDLAQLREIQIRFDVRLLVAYGRVGIVWKVVRRTKIRIRE